MEFSAGLGRHHIPAVRRRFFKRAIRIGRQYFSPLVTVIAGSVAAGENVAERMLETIERRWVDDRDLRAHLVDHVLHGLAAIRIVIVMQAHVEQGKLNLAQGLQAGLEILGGDHLVVERTRQGLTAFRFGCHVLQDFPFPAKIFHELRRQFDCIPFDAGNAGYANLVNPGQHVMQAVAELVEQGDHFVMRKQSRFDDAVDYRRGGEITGQVSNRGLYFAAEAAPGACIVHPCAATLAVAGIQVQIELADQLAVFLNPEKLDVRMPRRGLVGADVDRK